MVGWLRGNPAGGAAEVSPEGQNGSLYYEAINQTGSLPVSPLELSPNIISYRPTTQNPPLCMTTFCPIRRTLAQI